MNLNWSNLSMETNLNWSNSSTNLNWPNSSTNLNWSNLSSIETTYDFVVYDNLSFGTRFENVDYDNLNFINCYPSFGTTFENVDYDNCHIISYLEKFNITIDRHTSYWRSFEIYLQKIISHMQTSPMLEFYIRFMLSISYIFNITIKADLLTVRCQILNLEFQRHYYRRHDFRVKMNRARNNHIFFIYPLLLLKAIFIPHLIIINSINYFILRPVLYSIYPMIQAVILIIDDTKLQVISCYLDLEESEHTIRIVGGGPAHEFTYNELGLYSSQIISEERYFFHSYVLHSDQLSVINQSYDLIAIPNIPLNIILPYLNVSTC